MDYLAKVVSSKKYPASRRIVPCRNPGLNRGPLDLQSNALPTELFRLTWIVLQLGAFIGIELLDQCYNYMKLKVHVHVQIKKIIFLC